MTRSARTVHGGGDRSPRRHRVSGRADDRAREALRGGAAAGRRARGARGRISEAVSEPLDLEESLQAIVRTTMESPHATGGRRPGGRQARRPRARRARSRVRMPSTGGAVRSAKPGCDRDSRSRTTIAALLEAIADHQQSRSSTAARSRGASSPRRSTTASRTTSRLSPRCCASRPARHHVDARKALQDSVNRVLAHRRGARGLDRASRGRRRPRRPRRPAAGDARPGERRGEGCERGVEPVSLAGQQATAVALVFTELFQNALETAAATSRSRSSSATGRWCRRLPTTARGSRERYRYRLSIARARQGRAPGSARSCTTYRVARGGGLPA